MEKIFANTTEKKKTNLFLVLSGIFITNALIAEIIGVKIFSTEALLGIPQAQIKLFADFKLDFNLTAGAIIWPVVFITSDIINEYFGYSSVKKISIITAILISYAFLIIYFAIGLPPSDFWLDINNADQNGNSFNINFAFNKIFSQGLNIIIGSLVAFLVGQLLDAYIFQKLKKFTASKKIWLRATGSTLVSQLVDSFLVLYIAFYLLGNWPMDQVISIAIINYIYKFIMAVVLTPLLYLAHGIIDKYLGHRTAEAIIEKSMTK